MFKFPSFQNFKLSNFQIFKLSTVSNFQTFKLSNLPNSTFSNFQTFNFSNFSALHIFKLSNFRVALHLLCSSTFVLGLLFVFLDICYCNDSMYGSFLMIVNLEIIAFLIVFIASSMLRGSSFDFALVQKKCIWECAMKPHIVKRRRFRRPSFATTSFYRKRSLARKEQARLRLQLFLSLYTVIMIHELSEFSLGDNYDAFVDLLQQNMTEESDEEDACAEGLYEESTAQVCSDVYEYQQMQASAVESSSESKENSLEEENAELQRDLFLEDANAKNEKYGMLRCSQGLFVDPTEDYDADDFQDVAPVVENCSRYGVRGKSTLLPMDGCDMLKAQRFGCFVHGGRNSVSCSNSSSNSTLHTLTDEFRFVPDLVMALLISLFPDEANLKRMLSQTWAQTWEGWNEWENKQDFWQHGLF